MVGISDVFLTVAAIWVVSRVLFFIKGLKAVDYLHGLRVPFEPFSIPGILLPSSKTWNPGLLFMWDWKSTMYKKFNSEILSIVPFLYGEPTLIIRNMDIARQIISEESATAPFGRIPTNGGTAFWGPNIISSERDEWRKYRRIMTPSFNKDSDALVWSESVRTFRDLTKSEGWDTESVVEIPSFQLLTSKFALLIVSSCGFGLPFTWESPPAESGLGKGATIQDALQVITHSVAFSMAAPKWLWKVPIPWIKRTREAHDSMRVFMQNQVKTRRTDMLSGDDEDWKKDMFSRMVHASEQDGKNSMDDHELIGNVFALLFAGHETTGTSMAVTCTFLACHPEIQDEIAMQVREIVGDREPTFADYPKLDKVLAAFYEAVRLLPPGVILLRESKKDTTLVYPYVDSSGNERNKVLPVPKGTHIIIDIAGIQYNTRYFSEPEAFRPSRWYAKSNSSGENDEGIDLQDSEDYTAFSVGPRACIGRKFASTEAVCFLTMLLRDWKVEPLLLEGETKEDWLKRSTQVRLTLAMGVKEVPLRFVRR